MNAKFSLLISFVILLAASACSFQKKLVPLNSMQDLEYPYPTKTVSLSNNIELAYMDEGKPTAPALILIHGLGSYAPAWKNNIADLRKDYRCLAVDLPGYGKSSKGNYEGTMRFYADVLMEFMDALKLESATMVGHSMGGQIAITASLAYPDRVPQLILVSPAGIETFNEGQKEWFREVITAEGVRLTTVEQIKSNFGYNFFDIPKDAEFMIEDRINMRSADDFEGYCYAIAQSVRGMVDGPVYDYLPDLKARTLIIYGEQDNLIPNRYLNPGSTSEIAKIGEERIPNSTMHLVDKAGHFVHFEQSEKVNSLILEFLKK
ncbi:MAG: alpha/beta fold hydrolase [Phaeodactylibacter sp.]|nr:alpha/beta fold hydrolase [Phaeodactylibacter sp.]